MKNKKENIKEKINLKQLATTIIIIILLILIGYALPINESNNEFSQENIIIDSNIEIDNIPPYSGKLVITINNERLVPNYNLISNWVYSADSRSIVSVICNGRFIMEDGTETQLATPCLVAAQGTNTLEILNVDSIEVTYRTISKQSGGGMADFDLIHGGSAKEEA